MPTSPRRSTGSDGAAAAKQLGAGFGVPDLADFGEDALLDPKQRRQRLSAEKPPPAKGMGARVNSQQNLMDQLNMLNGLGAQ